MDRLDSVGMALIAEMVRNVRVPHQSVRCGARCVYVMLPEVKPGHARFLHAWFCEPPPSRRLTFGMRIAGSPQYTHLRMSKECSRYGYFTVVHHSWTRSISSSTPEALLRKVERALGVILTELAEEETPEGLAEMFAWQTSLADAVVGPSRTQHLTAVDRVLHTEALVASVDAFLFGAAEAGDRGDRMAVIAADDDGEALRRWCDEAHFSLASACGGGV